MVKDDGGAAAKQGDALPRLGLVLALWERMGGTDPWAQACETVRGADRLGYDSVWLTESGNRDPVTLLTHLATQTEKIQLGFGVVNVFSRSPAVLASTAATLDECRARLCALRASGVDAVNVSLPSYAPQVALPLLEALIA